MRTLIVMRGAPGTGKSTTIKKLGLDQYTLSSDAIRLLYSAPRLGLEGDFVISAHNDKKVWKDFHRILEKRMQQGELVVVDATHTQAKELNRYNTLAKKYRYRIGCIDFSTMPLEQIHKQNEQRQKHQIVPKESVEKLYYRCFASDTPQHWSTFHWEENNQHIHNIQKWLHQKPIDLSNYSKIHHVGSVHGCYSALDSYLPNVLPKDEFFIFLGDICGRGMENGKTLSLFMKLVQNKNVCILYGKKEVHLENWSNGRTIQSANEVLPQLKEIGITPRELRDVIPKLTDYFIYRFQDKHVLVTHGGLSTVPSEIYKVAAKTAQNGVGRYNENIDSIFSKQAPEGWYQVHGHRNESQIAIDAYSKSFNLEGRVQFGESLRVLVLDHGGFTPMYVKNPVFRNFLETDENKIPK